jgi:uncharacterized protein YceK
MKIIALILTVTSLLLIGCASYQNSNKPEVHVKGSYDTTIGIKK